MLSDHLYHLDALIKKHTVIFFTNWKDKTNFPEKFGSGIMLPGLDDKNKFIIYFVNGSIYHCAYKLGTDITWTKL